MKVGIFNLLRCRSPPLVRAQTRFPCVTTLPAQPRSTINHICPATSLIHYPLFLGQRNFSKLSNRRQVRSTDVRTLSTSSICRGKQEHKYLKPRGRPKFRQRLQDDDDVILEALKETEAQYGQHLDEFDHQDQELSALAQLPSYNARGEGLRSPYFTPPQHIARGHGQPYFVNKSEPSKSVLLSRRTASVTELEQELHFLAHNDPHPSAIHNILTILVRDHRVKPAGHHYASLILANTWPEFGDSSNVEFILSEMEAEGIEINGNIISAVLKVLAVHPSVSLTHKVLALAEKRWVQLSSQANHYLILAMIRTGQTELAAWSLDVLRSKEKSLRRWDRDGVPDYLVVLLIAEMVKMGDWEGILRYMYKLRNRRAADRDIPVMFWGWLLEIAAKAARDLTENTLLSKKAPSTVADIVVSPKRIDPLLSAKHYQQNQRFMSQPSFHLVQHIYNLYVSSMSLRPSYNTLLNILHTAVNTGTIWLAKSVIATMTYMDGIDADNGEPIAQIEGNVRNLVRLAEQRAAELETDETREERMRQEKLNAEEEKLKREDEEWWRDVIDYYGDGDDRTNNQKEDIHQSQSLLSPKSNSSIKSNTLSAANSKPYQVPTIQRTQTIQTTPDPLSNGTYSHFDPSTTSPGNLWPLFPPVVHRHTHYDRHSEHDTDGTTTTASALTSAAADGATATAVTHFISNSYIDPWEALGPRMSSKYKWTETQRHFKHLDRAERKEQQQRQQQRQQQKNKNKKERGRG